MNTNFDEFQPLFLSLFLNYLRLVLRVCVLATQTATYINFILNALRFQTRNSGGRVRKRYRYLEFSQFHKLQVLSPKIRPLRTKNKVVSWKLCVSVSFLSRVVNDSAEEVDDHDPVEN